MYGRKKKKYRSTRTKRKSGGSMLMVTFKKGRKRWKKYFKNKTTMKRAKAGLKTVGWKC